MQKFKNYLVCDNKILCTQMPGVPVIVSTLSDHPLNFIFLHVKKNPLQVIFFYVVYNGELSEIDYSIW